MTVHQLVEVRLTMLVSHSNPVTTPD